MAIIRNDHSQLAPLPTFQNTLDIVLYSLSATSKRQYEHTFATWKQFAQDNGFSPSQLTVENIIGYLESSDLAHRTKTARLSHLRKLLEALHAQQPSNEQIQAWFNQVKLLKIKRQASQDTVERIKHALKPDEIYDAFKVWKQDTKQHIRNRALLAVLFYAGLRRSEAAALQWRDIDLENGIITVRHGKGDKAREVPILSDKLSKYLLQWRDCIPERTYVFCGVRKNGLLRADKPVSTNAIYDVVKQTGDLIDIENLAPHDARRTLITNLLNSGASVSDAQFIAGHEDAQTTLGYAVIKDAKEVAGRVKLNY